MANAAPCIDPHECLACNKAGAKFELRNNSPLVALHLVQHSGVNSPAPAALPVSPYNFNSSRNCQFV